MGRVEEELIRVATSPGAEMHTQARIKALDFSDRARTVHFELGEDSYTVDARFVLANFGETEKS
jgi:hypothetical protein